MRNGPGTFAKLGLSGITGAILLAIGGWPVLAGSPTASGATGEVVVTLVELRNSKGTVIACMTPDPARFPRCRGDAKAYRVEVPASETTRLTFRGVKPGRYAIALLHDENGNGKADRALGMMPKEGFGFSRDAEVRMAPPKFDAAAFDFTGQRTTLTIRMRYML